MATLAEIFGVRTTSAQATIPNEWKQKWCPFTNRQCDVSANRGDRAALSLAPPQVSSADAKSIRSMYGAGEIPLGICTVTTQRRFQSESAPWIVCPKRVLELRSVPPVLPNEVRALIPIKPGTPVRCWWEFKYTSNEAREAGSAEDNDAADAEGRFFEYTFDYIIMPVSPQPAPAPPIIVGPPYIIEVMTSSTRGGGLTEHMVDALLLRPQRPMRGAVKSPYTPNYRQVFGRMASQLFVKAEVAEAWGGRTIWVMQDVLLEYIRQTTDFKPEPLVNGSNGNVFAVVYRLDDAGTKWDLVYDRTLRGPARAEKTPDFTGMLGAGYIPPLDHLISVLTKSAKKKRAPGDPRNWIDFTW